MEEFIISKSKVMAIFAHPDDAEMGAGATLASFAQVNSDIYILNVAKGDKGIGEISLRENEAIQAAEILGAQYKCLGYGDGDFDNDLKLREQLTHEIRNYKPDIVICPDPTSIFFSHLYVNHRDHRETGWAVIDVVSSAVGNPKYFPTSNSHEVAHLLCAGTQEPNCYVNITDTIEIKINAVLCHASQLKGQGEQAANSIREASAILEKTEGISNVEIFRYCAISSTQV